MYSSAFCKVYNEFGWNYFPEAFGEQLLAFLQRNNAKIKASMDLACGPGVLCELLKNAGVNAKGMDLSEGMIGIARERDPGIPYEVADMTTFCPNEKYDLVTCIGDAMNHITDLKDVEKIFCNVRKYLSPDGWFIFDILDHGEVALDEPIDLQWSDIVRARFMITQNKEGIINLSVKVYEDEKLIFEENITETVHDPYAICQLLVKCGFKVELCSQKLLEDQPSKGMKCFIAARIRE